MRYLIFIKSFRFFFPLAIFVGYSNINFSQSLKIGDTCPDLELRNIINYPKTFLKLSELNNKLIILDFWNTRCRGCIASFRHIDSLQKKFQKEIQIVLVTSETDTIVANFFTKRTKIYKPALPMITSDTLLKKYFPHVGVPHHVWVGGDRKIIAITEGYNATENHIQNYLKSKKILLAEKTIQKRPDLSAPLFTNAPSSFLNSITYYSYISRAIDSLSFIDARKRTFGSSRHNKIVMNKVPILRLYLTAFNEGQSKFFYNSNNVILDIKDTFLYWPPIDKNLLDSWNRDHLYLYELQVPPDDASGLYKIMRADLEKVFNLRGSIETRKMDCMVLVRTSDKDAIASSGKERKTYFKNASSDSIQCFQNIPFESFFAILKYRFKYAELPLVDATGYRENIDIAVSAVTIDAADYTVLKNDLKKYDLDLVKMKWDVDVLVLKEIDSKKQNK